MSHQQKGLFRVIHPFMRQTWLVIIDQRDAILSGNIRRTDDYKLFPIDFWSEANLFDFAARDSASNRRSIQHAWQFHVVDIASPAANFVASLQSRDRCAYDIRVVHITSIEDTGYRCNSCPIAAPGNSPSPNTSFPRR